MTITGYENLDDHNRLKDGSTIFYCCDNEGCGNAFKRYYFNEVLFLSDPCQYPLFKQHQCPECWLRSLQNSEHRDRLGRTVKIRNPVGAKEKHIKQSFNTMGTMNVGASNGMKSATTQAKVSTSRKKKFAEDPEFRARTAAATRKAWVDGKFEGVAVGLCKWYDHTDIHGTLHKLQGTWELKYAQYLDTQGIKYTTHRNRLPYRDEEGVERSYYPDFFLDDSDEYVEVKSSYWLEVQGHKVALVRNSNPGIKLKMLTELELRSLGIDVPLLKGAEDRIERTLSTG